MTALNGAQVDIRTFSMFPGLTRHMLTRSIFQAARLPIVGSCLCACALGAQNATPATDSSSSVSPTSTRPSVDLSGVLYASFQYGGERSERSANRFEIDRAYLTARSRVTDRLGARVTIDVYQQRDPERDDFYRGWAMRAKYAYAEYDLLHGDDNGFSVSAKFGLLQTAIINVEERVWNRGLQPVAVDRFGFFASADAGLSSTLTLPDGHGELYLGVTNGSGYTSRETDRFKDVAARFTWAPAPRATGILSTLRVSPWASLGRRASDFVDGRGTVQPVAAGLRKDRAGVLLTVGDPRVTFGTHVAWRFDEAESADTSQDTSPRSVDVTRRLVSVHALVRPRAFSPDMPQWPLALVFRTDEFRADTNLDESVRAWFAGLMYEFGPRASLTLDYQRQIPRRGSTAPDLAAVVLQLIGSF